MNARRAKIVCTIGPASESDEAVRALCLAGMDVARLNFSHGTAHEHAARAERIRRHSVELGKPVALLQDLSGPKIRTGVGGPAAVADGDRVVLIESDVGSATELAINYEGLTEDVEPGDRILLADGQVELIVESKSKNAVEARAEHGGKLRDRMGVNLPSRRVRLGALTDKDRRDLEHGLKIGVDFIALSFVRSADDVAELRALCKKLGRPTPIIAKIETPPAVESIDDIVQAADAVMVARGDLGVELAPERVPVVQKRILNACRRHIRPVIVATEMLQSMVNAPRPTRAEASDVAGAVFDGADAVMLSAETATGVDPARACKMMASIMAEAAASDFYAPPPADAGDTVPEAIARAACDVATGLKADVIVALTESGLTARLVSKARPAVPIVAFTHDDTTLRRLALYWGVRALDKELVTDPDELARRVAVRLKQEKLISAGAQFVMVYGAPVGERGSTNAVRVVTVE